MERHECSRCRRSSVPLSGERSKCFGLRPDGNPLSHRRSHRQPHRPLLDPPPRCRRIPSLLRRPLLGKRGRHRAGLPGAGETRQVHEHLAVVPHRRAPPRRRHRAGAQQQRGGQEEGESRPPGVHHLHRAAVPGRAAGLLPLPAGEGPARRRQRGHHPRGEVVQGRVPRAVAGEQEEGYHAAAARLLGRLLQPVLGQLPDVLLWRAGARALIGFVSNFGTLLSSQLISTLLEYKGFPVKNRITVGFYYIVALHIVAWVYGWVIQEKYTANPPAFDWADAGFVEGFFVLLLWDFARQALQNWLYYLLATKTDNISELSRFSGILRGQESFSQRVAFGLNTQNWHGGRVPLIVNTVLLVLAIYPTYIVMRDHVPVEAGAKQPVEEANTEEASIDEAATGGKSEFTVQTAQADKDLPRTSVARDRPM